MSSRFFIIEANRDYRLLLAHHLSSHWHEAEVTEFDPLAEGPLPEDLYATDYDLVLLGDTGEDHDALELLRNFSALKVCPPLVCSTQHDQRRTNLQG